jgi:hypothetical protein
MNIPMTLNIKECFRYAPNFNLTRWYLTNLLQINQATKKNTIQEGWECC